MPKIRAREPGERGALMLQNNKTKLETLTKCIQVPRPSDVA